MLTIYIDADACPVKEEVYRVATRYEMRVKVVAKYEQRVPANERTELIVKPDFGAVDDWIAEQGGPGDIVITADIPLAARCLAKEAVVLDPRGHLFSDNDIGAALATRQLLEELRQIQQFVLLYPPQGNKGPNRIATVLSKQTLSQQALAKTLGLDQLHITQRR